MIVNVLDKGYVKLLNVSGPTRRPEEEHDASDRDPAQAARISFNNMNEERTLEQDVKLSRYLMKNFHNSPFEMVDIWLEMKLPIFVARHFVRHRTASINEISGRYVKLEDDWYIPEIVGGKADSNKQGQVDNLPIVKQDKFKEILNWTCDKSYREYENALKDGVAPQHARLILHVNHYTKWLWKQDLHNLMHFMSLRMDEHAQIEAQEYANAVYELLSTVLPETMLLFSEYRRWK